MIYINNILKIFILQCILLTFPLFLKSQIDTIHLKEVEVKELYFNSPNTNKHQIDNFRLMHSVSANIGEILSYEPGLNVKTFGDGSLTTVSFRGTDASHTKVDWNGMQINSAMNGQIDFSLIPVLPYNNLNLFYGANSLITSSGAFGGQVSFNSPDFNKLSPFIEI
ncbi:MAG: Plug domain-containing protein, partial [Bacteroidetes bacterium]|nr:Plug domain-containing protein [Bacteroidota bacterium]